MLEAISVTKQFGGLVAVSAVDFAIPEGTIVSLIGPNGAGKTTFFNVIAGLYKPTSGRIVFDGTVISGRPPHRITRLGIARTFQNIRLFQNMTALENVMVGHHSRMRATPFEAVLRTPRERREEQETRARARQLLEFVGLADRDDVVSKNLPYGDQRRLEMARALATEPKLLLL
ncbi:MAG: ATP-binding cassette domain-containing protein, partial [Chloroflexi bacterium]